MRKHSRSSKHGGFKEVFLNPNDKGSGNHAQGANRGRTVLNLSYKLRPRVISRVILARKDYLTPFDLKAQIFRFNLEFSTCYRGQKIFRKLSFLIEIFLFGTFASKNVSY